MRLFGKQLAAADLALVLAGVLGGLAYVLLLPAQHPDSAASYRLGKEQAAEVARAFAQRHSAAIPEDARQNVGLWRNAELLERLQREQGRPATVRLLKTEARERLPAYHWRVAWEKDRDEGEDYEMEVRLSSGGAVYAFHPGRPATNGAPPLNREALAHALGDWEAPAEAPTLTEVPDSLLKRHLSFDFSRKGVAAQQDAAGQERIELPEASALGQRLGGRVFVLPSLDREAAVRLARYHLRQTALAGYTFRPDSVWTQQQGDRETATVRFLGSSFHGQRPRVDVTVVATGALRELETSFAASAGAAADVPANNAPPTQADVPENERDNVEVSIESDTVAGIVTGVLYAVLALAALFVFFRRMNARLVDTKAALRDALWGGLFAAALAAVTSARAIFSDVPEFWMALLAFSMAVAFTGAGGAFLIFLASGAMDSVARAQWPEKLTALDLVRHGAVRNVPVGAALGRGLAAAGVLLGGTTLLLVLLPGAAIKFSQLAGTLGRDVFVSPFGYIFATNGWTGLFVGLTVMLGLGTWLRSRWPSPWVVVPALAAALTLLQVGFLPLQPMGRYALVVGFTALVLAWAFWRFDFIAFFTAQLLASVLWWSAPGWMVAGSPLAVSAALAVVAAGGVLVLAFVGLFSGKTSTAVPDYVPSYVEELAERERLKRDIEIAQQVQRDFLPHRMPRIEGLDLAALCLPAREVGGDYYDFIELAGGRLAVVIGDVSGKGIEASFYMTLVKGFLQTLATEDTAPADVLRRLNTLFCRNAPGGTFITMIYGVADPAAGTFRFARAGHNPLVHRRAGEANVAGSSSSTNGRPGTPAAGGAQLLRPRGMAIGLVEGPRFDDVIDEVTLPLHPGDALVLYTDGFPEARGAGGKEFGEERLLEGVRRRGQVPARQLLQTLADDVHAFVEASGRHDDMTMVVVKRTDTRTGPPAADRESRAAEQAPAKPAG